MQFSIYLPNGCNRALPPDSAQTCSGILDAPQPIWNRHATLFLLITLVSSGSVLETQITTMGQQMKKWAREQLQEAYFKCYEIQNRFFSLHEGKGCSSLCPHCLVISCNGMNTMSCISGRSVLFVHACPPFRSVAQPL